MALESILGHNQQCEYYAVDVNDEVIDGGVIEGLDVNLPRAECHENAKQLQQHFVRKGDADPYDGILVGAGVELNNFIYAIPLKVEQDLSQ